MKKHRTARLLSVILAVVMIFGSISVGVTAAYAPYLDDALTDNYNTIDQVTLTEAQQASLLLDKDEADVGAGSGAVALAEDGPL